MFRRILVPLDGSSVAEAVLPLTIQFAKIFGARVDLLTILFREPSESSSGGRNLPAHRFACARAMRYLGVKRSELRKEGLEARIGVEAGEAAEVIVEVLCREEYDLVALTSRGSGRHRNLSMGSTATAVLLNACASILMVPDPDPAACERRGCREPRMLSNAIESKEPDGKESGGVLLPVDCSRGSDRTMIVASDLAREMGIPLQLVHILGYAGSRGPPFHSRDTADLAGTLQELNRIEARRYLWEITRRLRFEGLDAEGQVVSDSKSRAETLSELAARRSPDLIVLGAPGRRTNDRPLGGTSLKLMLSARWPILLLRGGEGRSSFEPDWTARSVRRVSPWGYAMSHREPAL